MDGAFAFLSLCMASVASWHWAFGAQAWTPMHVKNGEKGAVVREVKAVWFFMRRDGLPTRAHWLIVTRDPHRGERTN